MKLRAQVGLGVQSDRAKLPDAVLEVLSFLVMVVVWVREDE